MMLKLNNLVGEKVINKQGEEGIILLSGEYIKVDFGGRVAEFSKDAFIKGFLKLLDKDLQKVIDEKVENNKKPETKTAEEIIIKSEEAAIKQEEENTKKVPEEDCKTESAGLVGKRVVYTKTGKKGQISAVREDGIIIVTFDNGETKTFLEKAFSLGALVFEETCWPGGISPEVFFPIYHPRFLKIDTVYNFKEVERIFGIHVAVFGKGSNPTPNSVVLISVVSRKGDAYVYHDRWAENGDCIFSGEGKSGNQSMKRGNLAINNAAQDGKIIHLLVRFSSDEYFYQGKFKLVDYRYEDDGGEDGKMRKEFKFRLRKLQ